MLPILSGALGWHIPARNLALMGLAVNFLIPGHPVAILAISTILFLTSIALVDLNKIPASEPLIAHSR